MKGERGPCPTYQSETKTLAGSKNPRSGPLPPFHVRSKNDPAVTISGLVQRNYPTPPDSISFTKINVPAGDRSRWPRCLFNTLGFESRGADRWIPIGRSDVCRRRSVLHFDGHRSENCWLKTNQVLERLSGQTFSAITPNEKGRPLLIALCGEYRSRTGDLLHAMQAL